MNNNEIQKPDGQSQGEQGVATSYLVEEVPKFNHFTGEGLSHKFDQLKKAGAIPWLIPNLQNMKTWEKTFPQGQLLITDLQGSTVGYCSMTKMFWHGDPDKLIAHLGRFGTTYNSYSSEGNTLFVRKLLLTDKGNYHDLASAIVGAVSTVAKKEGVEHMVGLFQPSYSDNIVYENRTDRMKQVVTDPLLSALSESGVNFIKLEAWYPSVDNEQLGIGLNDFYTLYRDQYYPDLWEQVSATKYYSPDGGAWHIDPDHGPKAIYLGESLWGEIPLTVQGVSIKPSQKRYSNGR